MGTLLSIFGGCGSALLTKVADHSAIQQQHEDRLVAVEQLTKMTQADNTRLVVDEAAFQAHMVDVAFQKQKLDAMEKQVATIEGKLDSIISNQTRSFKILDEIRMSMIEQKNLHP